VDVDFRWRDEIVGALTSGWPQSARTLSTCLRAVNERGLDAPLRYDDDALLVLVSGYPQHPRVAEFIAHQLRHDKYGLSTSEDKVWWHILHNFRDNPQVVQAIDEWLPTREIFDHVSVYAALTGRTETGKRYLLAHLEKGWPHGWPIWVAWVASALLEGWGMEDAEVAEALTRSVWGPEKEASWIGLQLPQIISDRSTCRQRLLDILKSPDCERYDSVLAALPQVGTNEENAEAISIVLERAEQDKRNSWLADPAYLLS
jgi:hypothetical protein